MGKPPYSQQFRKEWLKDKRLSWLREVPGKPGKGFCIFCKANLNAKLGDLLKHTKTSKHENCVVEFSTKKSQQTTLDFQPQKDPTKTAIVKLCLYIAAHSSFMAVDHLSETCKDIFSDSVSSKDLKLHRTKCTKVIQNVLGPHFSHSLKDDIGSQCYSLIIDESTDITITKILAVVVRYYSVKKREMVVTFLGLKSLPDGTAESVCAVLKSLLREYDLPLQRMIGLGTDNASNMVGINNGVYQKLKSEVPNLLLIRCICHSLQLCISHATKECLPRCLEFLIKETYNWFAHSSIRQALYKKIYETLNDGQSPLKITQVCDTRWLSIETAVSRILSQWLELKTHFMLVNGKERCYTTDTLCNMYQDVNNYLFLVFLQPILFEVQKTNKKFQSDHQDPVKLLDDLIFLVQSMCTKILIPGMRFDFQNTNVEDHLDPKPYLGYKFELELKKVNLCEQIENVRQKCVAFLKSLIAQLRQRLPENVKLLQHVSILSASSCLKPLKPDIVPLAEILHYDADTISLIHNQWINLHHINWFEVSDTVKLWIEIHSYKNASGENTFQELSNLAISVLTLPHSNADVERVFSSVNIIKSKTRNRMKQDTLLSILQVRYGLKREKKCCKDYAVPGDVLKKIGNMATYENNENNDRESDDLSCIFENGEI